MIEGRYWTFWKKVRRFSHNGDDIYRAGPLKIATFFPMGTKYDCNLDRKKGPNMIAMLVTKGTKYNCNDKSKADHI